MKFTEIIAIGAGLVCGGCLESIQLRRIIKGELSPFGIQSFKDAAKIEIDKIDKRLLLISGISFLLCMAFVVISYG